MKKLIKKLENNVMTKKKKANSKPQSSKNTKTQKQYKFWDGKTNFKLTKNSIC